jgi:hypothetical protein
VGIQERFEASLTPHRIAPPRKEQLGEFMSKTNGDKARFHVARKQNIKRRAKGRALLLALAVKTDSSVKKASASKARSGKSAE